MSAVATARKPGTGAPIRASLARMTRQERVFVAFAVLLLACLPVISRVPEHRGSW